jgi:parallel beta-helix repeat protein
LSGLTAANAITLPAAGIRIVGAGRHNTVLRFANTTAASMLTAIDADNIEIEGVGFDGQSTARLAWQRSFVFRGCRKIRVHNCWFYRIGDGGVGLVGTTGFGGSDAYGEGTRQTERYICTDNLVEDCWGTVALIMKYIGAKDVIISRNIFKNSTTIAISVESEDSTTEYAERVVVTDNIIEGLDYAHASGTSPVAYGISIGERARSVVCSGNVVDGVAADTLGAGILISTSPSQNDTEAIDIAITSNTIRTVTGASGRAYGILLQAGDTSIGRITIAGNVIDATEDGIGFDLDAGADTTGYVENVTVSGNVISNSTEFGIFSNTLASSGALALRNCAITGNTVSGSTSHGINIKAEYCTISGNNLRSNGGVGLVLTTGCQGNTISGNTIVLSGDNGLQGVGTDTLITGNTIMNNGQTNSGTYYGINITSGARAVISANMIGDNQGGPTQDYCVRGQSDTIIRNNHLIGSVSGSIFGGINNYNYAVMDSHGNVTATASDTSRVQTATIATGAVTVNSGVRLATIDTEGAAASDDLDTITYAGVVGDLLRVRAANNARTVVVKDGTGNMRLSGDFSLDNGEDSILLQWDGTNWAEVSRSDNAA